MIHPFTREDREIEVSKLSCSHLPRIRSRTKGRASVTPVQLNRNGPHNNLGRLGAGQVPLKMSQIPPEKLDHDPRKQARLQQYGLRWPRPFQQSHPSILDLILRCVRNPQFTSSLRHQQLLPEVRSYRPGRELYCLAQVALSEIALPREGSDRH